MAKQILILGIKVSNFCQEVLIPQVLISESLLYVMTLRYFT